jgi:hypothetical protein
MSKVQTVNKGSLTIIEAVGLLLTALGALPAYAGMMGKLTMSHGMSNSSSLGVIASWDHSALFIGGLVIMAIGGIMGLASHQMRKQSI